MGERPILFSGPLVRAIELMRAAAARVSFGPDLIAIDLLIDAETVVHGDDASASTYHLHRIPAGLLRVATPRRRAA